jgi:hypothetical protein
MTGATALAGLVVVWVLPGLIDSHEQRILHRAAVHRDNSLVQTGVVTTIKTPVVLFYRDVNGNLHRILADETEANRFVNDTLIYLNTERNRIKAQAQKDIAALLETAFADRQDAISCYADWYFEWTRSWALLKEASAGGLKGLMVNNVQGVFEASRNEVEAYLIRNFERFVLKPELRNPIIEAGISRILADAHIRYLATLSTIEDRAQVFLSKYTRHLEVIDPHARLNITIDWDAQKWKAPRYAADDEAFAAILRGTGFVTVSGLIIKTIGPPIERTLAAIFWTTASRVVTNIWPELLGLVVGSVIEPGAGSFVGWVVGLSGGLAFDYLFNKYRERNDRADFERANAEALNAVIDEWSRAIQRELFRAVDVWFDDTGNIVAEHRIHKQIAPKVW